MEPPVKISEIQYSVVKIDCYHDTDYLGSGTGFFYQHEKKTYLVSNKHVFSKKWTTPNNILIKLHTSRQTNTENEFVKINLYDAQSNSLWLEHDNSDVDIAIIEIKLSKEKYYFTSYSKKNLIEKESYIQVGEPVVVLGYPKQYHDKMHNLPIGRTGFIASVYGSDFDGFPFFLIDSTLHEGTSGSPVIRVTEPNSRAIFAGFPPYLLGVNAGEQEINGMRIGVHRVYYANYIDEILKFV